MRARTFKFHGSLVLVTLLKLLSWQGLALTFSVNISGARKPSFLAWAVPSCVVRSAASNMNEDVVTTMRMDMSSPELDPGTSGKYGLTNSTKKDDALKNMEIPDDLIRLAQAPQLSFEKYITMQDKRVVVTIRYSGDAGLKPYFLTLAKKLKASHPDVMIERRILADIELGNDEPTFEVLVDGRLVLGRGKKQKAIDVSKARSVFVSMQELDLAISRARRRRRPATAYGGGTRTTLQSNPTSDPMVE